MWRCDRFEQIKGHHIVITTAGPKRELSRGGNSVNDCRVLRDPFFIAEGRLTERFTQQYVVPLFAVFKPDPFGESTTGVDDVKIERLSFCDQQRLVGMIGDGSQVGSNQFQFDRARPRDIGKRKDQSLYGSGGFQGM